MLRTACSTGDAMRDKNELPLSMQRLSQMKTMEDLLRWARVEYGDGAGRMRCPHDLQNQCINSAEPIGEAKTWVSSVFVRLPETATTYGGYQTVCVAKVLTVWPEGRILSVIYEP